MVPDTETGCTSIFRVNRRTFLRFFAALPISAAAGKAFDGLPPTLTTPLGPDANARFGDIRYLSALRGGVISRETAGEAFGIPATVVDVFDGTRTWVKPEGVKRVVVNIVGAAGCGGKGKDDI